MNVLRFELNFLFPTMRGSHGNPDRACQTSAGNARVLLQNALCGLFPAIRKAFRALWPTQRHTSFSRRFQPREGAFPNERAFELGDCHQNVELESSGWIVIGGVDSLADRDKPDLIGIKLAD